MATLTLPPTAAPGCQVAQEGLPDATKKLADDAADPSGLDSGWVVLGKSDIVPADLAAAAAGHQRLGFTPLPMLPIWAQMMLGGVVYTVVPFYKRARKVEGETLDNVETAVEVVERVAEVTEKLAANAAKSLPKDGSLQKVAVEIEYIAEVVDKDAHKVEDVIKKIEELSDKVDAAVEPVIEELEKDFKPNPTSSSGSEQHHGYSKAWSWCVLGARIWSVCNINSGDWVRSYPYLLPSHWQPIAHRKAKIAMPNTSRLLVLLVTGYTAALASATTFIVGDEQGWTMGIDYINWVKGKTFAVGDKLVFNYSSEEHTVTEVRKDDYFACAGGDALSNDRSGSTNVTLTAPGTRYFICNIPGHCTIGMKIAVTVEGGVPPPSPTGAAAWGAPVPSMGAVVAAAAGAVFNLALS
ncbi:hypothetical protein EJB05_43403 [Eragrostis curvula]|uniref:Phytocyanin domain-containing protein n=1 Tax=Eragrostis curvula TaxID=38414 RepID=A0A5J9TF16_9POAL|nr:hypothetical protein EJB05_43403 [Eragrostis curvula]